jgi:hypothetical protein
MPNSKSSAPGKVLEETAETEAKQFRSSQAYFLPCRFQLFPGTGVNCANAARAIISETEIL